MASVSSSNADFVGSSGNQSSSVSNSSAQTALPSPPSSSVKRTKKVSKEQLSPLTNYLIGGVSACTAELFVYPLDTTKTRMQVAQDPSQRRALITARSIIVNEGFGGFYTGFSTACARHLVYSGCRFLTYELFREKVFMRDEDGSFPIWKSAVSALSAGAIGQFIASPTDLVKVRMQTEGLRVLSGSPAEYHSARHCAASLVRQLGITGMWRGCVPNCQRAALVQLGDLTAYDTSKQWMRRHWRMDDNVWLHAAASICAGLVATVMSTPSDVLKSRMMAEPTRYSGTLDCLKQTVRNDGFLALYKGFLPIWGRMGPKALIMFLTLERLRNLAGGASF